MVQNVRDLGVPVSTPVENGQAPPEPTTWEPIDWGPYQRGEIEHPQPTVGIARSDGEKYLYPGREHAVVGETESGKSWLALGCAAPELTAGNHVVYIHYEEPDAESTYERLGLLGVPPPVIAQRLHFAAPTRPLQAGWLAPLLDPPPTLVIHDGVNEAMSLIGAPMDTDGVAAFRRALITPFLNVGAATLACDHVPMSRDPGRRDAYGSVHKGNALNGARLALETVEPFGRGLRGVSNVFVTKDRPGHLRTNGRPTKTPGKTYVGTLVADAASPFEPFSLCLYAPKDDGDGGVKAGLADAVFDVLVAAPERFVESKTRLAAYVRAAGHPHRATELDAAIEDLIVANRVEEVGGTRNKKGYRALTSSRDSDT